jgi:hypothetical protein
MKLIKNILKGKHNELLGKSHTKTAKEGQLILEQTSYECDILYELATNNKKNSR